MEWFYVQKTDEWEEVQYPNFMQNDVEMEQVFIGSCPFVDEDGVILDWKFMTNANLMHILAEEYWSEIREVHLTFIKKSLFDAFLKRDAEKQDTSIGAFLAMMRKHRN